MPKPNKKKNGSSKSKAAYKAKMEDRKQQAIGYTIAPAQAQVEQITKFTILPGDRVWFYHEETLNRDNPNTYRGILQSFGDGDIDGRFCQIHPLSNYVRGDPSVVVVRDTHIYRDLDAWTTRYRVGDDIVCKTHLGWLPAKIKHLWPIWQVDQVGENMPCYSVECFPTHGNLFLQTIVRDDDSCLTRWHRNFRFKVGNLVTFDREQALPLAEYTPSNRWATGVVVERDVLGLNEVYAVYKCVSESDVGLPQVYYITKDVDECIATADKSKGLERFMECIDQGCSYEHLEFLVKHYDLDLPKEAQVILELALRSGSFVTLRWLDEHLQVDSKIDNLFLQMASFPEALRFFSEQSAYVENSNIPLDEWNWDNVDFVQELVASQNLPAMTVVLSLKNSLFWTIASKLEKVVSQETAPNESNTIASLMWNEALNNATLYLQVCEINNIGSNTAENEKLWKIRMDPLAPGNEDVKFIRFVREWGFHGGMPSIMTTLAKHGFAKLFKALYRADKSVIGSNENQSDVEETENLMDVVLKGNLSRSTTNSRAVENRPKLRSYLYLLKYLALGPGITDFDSFAKFLEEKCKDQDDADIVQEMYKHELNIIAYLHLLKNMALSGPEIEDFDSFVDFLKAESKDEENGRGIQDVCKFQMNRMLPDDSTSSGRASILDFLVREQGWPPPNMLDVIRMREGGIFQWILTNSTKNLHHPALYEPDLYSPVADALTFLGEQALPRTCSLGTFLAFACVECDSFQILAWLVEKQQVNISEDMNGFNILHGCAYFGRMEMIVWLRTRPEWDELLESVATREGFEQNNAAHIATKRGYTMISELLLELGCSHIAIVNGKLETIKDIAATSKHEYVREWGKERAHHFELEKIYKKFLKVLRDAGAVL